MKLLTRNTHSLREENHAQKLEWFVETVLPGKVLNVIKEPVVPDHFGVRIQTAE